MDKRRVRLGKQSLALHCKEFFFCETQERLVESFLWNSYAWKQRRICPLYIDLWSFAIKLPSHPPNDPCTLISVKGGGKRGCSALTRWMWPIMETSHCESCPTQMSWKVKFKCQSCFSCFLPVRPIRPIGGLPDRPVCPVLKQKIVPDNFQRELFLAGFPTESLHTQESKYS